jgi:hypothetical protein
VIFVRVSVKFVGKASSFPSDVSGLGPIVQRGKHPIEPRHSNGLVVCPSLSSFVSAMSNLPSQQRPSHPQSPSDSWHTVPSVYGETGSTSNNADLEESLFDLNPSIPLVQSQDGSDSSGLLVVREKKKCWICLAEEDERTPDGSPVNPSPWSKACACSLDAHESCLITWINQSLGSDTNKTVFLLVSGV